LLDDVQLQLVVIVEVLQEPLVDRVQVCDEKVVHWVHLDPSQQAERRSRLIGCVQGPSDPSWY
jgi:hypothetical protein